MFVDCILSSESHSEHFDALTQERRNPIANALELRLSCTNSYILKAHSIDTHQMLFLDESKITDKTVLHLNDNIINFTWKYDKIHI